MEGQKKTTTTQRFLAVRQSKPIATLNKVCASPIGLSFFALLTLISYLFSLEILLYAIVLAYVIYVCLFGEDFFTIIPFFLFCYVSPSPFNNPGRADTSLFYGAGGVVTLLFGVAATIAVILRMSLDKSIGFRRLFTQKRKLTWGFFALALAFFCSGVGSEHYTDIFWKNIFFVLLQVAALSFLYFFFSATVHWEKRDKRYLAWTMLVFGLLVFAELVGAYFMCGAIENGAINRSKIQTGWGNYNNVGAMITISIPFAFYLSTTKRGFLLLPLAALLTAGALLSCSRSSFVVAIVGAVVCYVYAAIKTKGKLGYFLISGALLGIALLVCLIFSKKIAAFFADIPAIFNGGNPHFIEESWSSDNSTGNHFGGLLGLFNDAHRFETYGEGLKVFLQYPLFGESFFHESFSPDAFSIVTAFSNFFPARWHNTIVQMLASCGIFGLGAYLFHRIQTLRLFFTKRSTLKTFIGVGVALLLMMSLLDCHLFNIGPAFFYAICLLFAEQTPADEKAPKKVKNRQKTPPVYENNPSTSGDNAP